MPTISQFYGILILMHISRKEHNPPHIHAIYGEYEATFAIDSGELLHGVFPAKGTILVKEFIGINRSSLLDMWNSETYRKLPPLK